MHRYRSFGGIFLQNGKRGKQEDISIYTFQKIKKNGLASNSKQAINLSIGQYKHLITPQISSPLSSNHQKGA